MYIIALYSVILFCYLLTCIACVSLTIIATKLGLILVIEHKRVKRGGEDNSSPD